MVWDDIHEHWPHLRGVVRRRWTLLTDDDMVAIDGHRSHMVDVVVERYRCPRAVAAAQVDQLAPALVSVVLRVQALGAPMPWPGVADALAQRRAST
jgi:uncharacterized protein YjbJ (UPF0337 family)